MASVKTNKMYIYIGKYGNGNIKIGYCTVFPADRQYHIRKVNNDKSFNLLAYYAIDEQNKPLGLLFESIVRYGFNNLKGYKYLEDLKNNDHFENKSKAEKNIKDFIGIMDNAIHMYGIENYKLVIKG